MLHVPHGSTWVSAHLNHSGMQADEATTISNVACFWARGKRVLEHLETAIKCCV